MSVKDEIIQIGITASDAEEVRAKHSRDASVFSLIPEAVAYPHTIDDIKKLVRFAKQKTDGGTPVSLTPRAGGTDMSGGPLSKSVVVSMEQFQHDVEVDTETKSAYVEMGTMYRDLEKETIKHGLLLGSYTSSKDLCGVAGMIGNNASGEKSIRHGATIDNVIALRAVVEDGNEYEFGPLTKAQFDQKQIGDTFEASLYRTVASLLSEKADAVASLVRPVPKAASGYRIERVYDQKSGQYNLSKLFVGSQGTLGIITRAHLRLIEKSAHERLIVAAVKDLSQLSDILTTIMSNEPEGVETFDINTFEVAREFLPTETARVAPIIEGAGLLILAQFAEESAEATDHRAHACADMLTKKGYAVTYVEDPLLRDSAWKIRRSSFGVMRDHVEGTFHAVPCIEDVIVPVARFTEFIPELLTILQSRDIRYGFHGHIGDGALRIIPVFDMADPDTPERIVELCRNVFELVMRLGGNMSADHSDGIIRTPFLPEFYAPAQPLFEAIKHAFDPSNIFNPGKKVGGTFTALEEGIIRG